VRLPSACADEPKANAANTKAAAELKNFRVIEVIAFLPVQSFVCDSFVTT